MGEEAIKMLQDSIKAFLQEDSQLAREVCVRDAIVDGLRDQIWRELITFMASDPTTIERSLHLLRISRCLERVADLATNLAEDTVYIVEGEIIKHHRGNF
jgi:phosphate transport system protein